MLKAFMEVLQSINLTILLYYISLENSDLSCTILIADTMAWRSNMGRLSAAQGTAKLNDGIATSEN
jgi:hypothetical protein